MRLKWPRIAELRLGTQFLLVAFLNFAAIGAFKIAVLLPIIRLDIATVMGTEGQRLCTLGVLQRNLTLAYEWLWLVAALGVLLGVCLLVGRALCGWACPIGLLQDLLTRLRNRLGLAARELPTETHQRLAGIKFALLGTVFLLSVSIGLADWGSSAARSTFLSYLPAGTARVAPYCALCPTPMVYYLSDVSLGTGNLRLDDPIVWGLIFIAFVFIVGAFAIPRFWCRYFCPVGALSGCFNRVSLLQLRQEAADCDNCDQCVAVCPTRQVELPGSRAGLATFSNCTLCGQCVEACPRQALSLTFHNYTLLRGKQDP